MTTEIQKIASMFNISIKTAAEIVVDAAILKVQKEKEAVAYFTR